ncbi:DEAD/DEAH box helicase family protein [Silvanigrella aquatica]|uniref:Restriction endonuclease subunit R n=1 Tax=Silvanigrella aquatica TaxID=1915309 RepID=A0A1L4D3Z8_9BACT|nr:DEAD/DEAH box helicase family protein [Silvanigrella aquatica]APJ04945.1 restriction endonuclease subunit R [Silvanigrella aquatica]
MSNFSFLQADWEFLYEAANKAENSIHHDPRTSCFYTRRCLELAVSWLYKFDNSLSMPYQDNLSSLIHEKTFKDLVGEALFQKMRIITKLGNNAVHSSREVTTRDAILTVKELFHICYWLARGYNKYQKLPESLMYNDSLVPQTILVPKKTIEQLKTYETEYQEQKEKNSKLINDKTNLDSEIEKLRAEIAEIKKLNSARIDTHDYSEEQTRDYFIDLLLKESGWSLGNEKDREYKVTGMPSNSGVGYVDYVLWGDDGKPLGVVEAKRTKKDPQIGKEQAKLYADCLEKEHGVRPVIFYTNGYDHYLWDDLNYPPRKVQGFYTKQELQLLIQRRNTKKSIVDAEINDEIAGRYYQYRAIKKICESFEKEKNRKALVVMATGTGKTRTVIALCDVLMQSNWVKRVLFLADRVSLVKQALNAFKKFLPNSSPVNLIEDHAGQGRVCVSTYQTMMGLINETNEEKRIFTPGYFDLIIVDEAHRSVYQKYKHIFSYFDSLLVGLTATPRSEIDRNTYDLFDLQENVPTDAYELSIAIEEKYLVPPIPTSVPTWFLREGIKYNELSDQEKQQWDEIEWSEEADEIRPQTIDASALNNWLFNVNTVDKVLEYLMTRGICVNGGDRIGKTIIFAKNQAHANFIAERFDANYPHFKGSFAKIITHSTAYAQNILEDFSIKEKEPHIAISVDMLDTGIDVPEVVNLVFFKMVRSKTKFWQMIGRGTRLCPDLFAPGKDKENFYIFDYCQNLEFFGQNPELKEPSVQKSISHRLFTTRLEYIQSLNNDANYIGIIDDTKKELHKEIAAMNVENFVVRHYRKSVEKFANFDSWKELSEDDYEALSDEVAGLPCELEAEPQELKRFDILMYQMQISILNDQSEYQKYSEKLISICNLLQEKSNIPSVAKHMDLIIDIQNEEWWQDINIPILENTRKNLRNLVVFIEKSQRRIVYTNFEDIIDEGTIVPIPISGENSNFSAEGNLENFKIKAQLFLKKHLNHISIHKIKMNVPLTKKDLLEIEKIFIENNIGNEESIHLISQQSDGLGVFIRSLVGLDKEAAKKAFSLFLNGKTLSSSQINFINLIIDHLTSKGNMDPKLLYESPFTDLSNKGPEGIFNIKEIDHICEILSMIHKNAKVA